MICICRVADGWSSLFPSFCQTVKQLLLMDVSSDLTLRFATLWFHCQSCTIHATYIGRYCCHWTTVGGEARRARVCLPRGGLFSFLPQLQGLSSCTCGPVGRAGHLDGPISFFFFAGSIHISCLPMSNLSLVCLLGIKCNCKTYHSCRWIFSRKKWTYVQIII